MSQQAALAQEFNLAIRSYAGENIRPFMEKFVDKDTFIPETMSTSFISRSIFEKVKKKFPGVIIRFSSDNPRNPFNSATLDELRMIDYFGNNPQVNRLIEETQFEGRRYLTYFSPMVMTKECLRCHTDPEDAPAELIKRYGPIGSFHRKLGEVAGLDTVGVPVEAITASLASEMRSRSMILAVVFVLLFSSIFYVFRFVVGKRLVAMASHFDEIAAHAESPWMIPVEVKGNDEISVVGIAFNKLVEQLRVTHATLEQRVSERTEELRQANAQLQLELTERQRTEENLRKSEQKFRLMAESIPDVFWMGDVGGGEIIYISPAYEQIWGRSHDSLYNSPESFFEAIHPEDRERVVATILGGHSVDGGFDYEYRIIRPDGEVRWIHDRGVPIRNQRGEIQLFTGLATDITERKRAEEALAEQRELMDYVIRHDPNAIAVYDSGLRYVFVSERYLDDYGVKEKDIIGKHHYEVFPEMPQRWKDVHQRVLAGEIEWSDDDYFERPDGSITYNRWECRPWYRAGGRIGGMITYTEVTTERKLAEMALRESEEKFRLVFEKAPIGIMLYDQTSLVTELNEKFAEIIGAPKEKLIGFNLISQLRDEQMREAVAASFRGGVGYYEGDYCSVTSGKSTAIRAIYKPIFSPEGVVSGGVSIFEDITDRKKAEVEQLRFTKLESMSILAGGIAHDFNNILTTILGNISLAMLNRNLGEDGMESLGQAEQACSRAQELSGQLLTFAKGGAPIKKVISLAKLVRESGKLALAGSKSRCEFSIPEDLWSVKADEGQINQVINNLLINADHAMPSGGIIKIEGGNILVGKGTDLPLAEGKYVKLTIADQGIGIPRKHLGKLFDPYFTTKQKGSGLGLATAYSIIKKHSGHIKVESQVGVGTTFHIYLPAKEGDQIAAIAEQGTPIIGRGKVLVMDDDEKIREILCRMLTRLGYEADSASDGSQAIEKFVEAKESGRPFNAVILDLTIPGGLGGKETVEKLLRIDPQIKAIVSSGYSDNPIMADFQKYGFSEVIAKPYKIMQMSKILQRIIPKKGD
jgi:PAS domain S-box-containing protein